MGRKDYEIQNLEEHLDEVQMDIDALNERIEELKVEYENVNKKLQDAKSKPQVRNVKWVGVCKEGERLNIGLGYWSCDGKSGGPDPTADIDKWNGKNNGVDGYPKGVFPSCSLSKKDVKELIKVLAEEAGIEKLGYVDNGLWFYL